MKNECSTPPEYLAEVASLLAAALLRLRGSQLPTVKTGSTGLIVQEERSSVCKQNGE